MPPKRKRASLATATAAINNLPPVLHGTSTDPPTLDATIKPPAPKRQASRRGRIDTNPDHNADILDGKTAMRASPDADEKGEAFDITAINGDVSPDRSAKTNGVKSAVNGEGSDSALSEINTDTQTPTPAKKQKKSPTKSSIAAKKGSDEIKAFKAEQAAKKAADAKIKKEDDVDVDEWDKRADPDGDETGPVEDVDALKREAKRPPPVNSDYLPLPWKGRLGYVSSLCLHHEEQCG